MMDELVTRRPTMLTAELTLDLADTARQRGCREAAESLYNAVLSRFAGDLFDGIRQRAAVGLSRL